MHSDRVGIRALVKAIRTRCYTEQIVSKCRLSVIITIRGARRKNWSVRVRFTPKVNGFVISNVRFEDDRLAEFAFETDVKLIAFRNDQVRRKASENRLRFRKLSRREALRVVNRN